MTKQEKIKEVWGDLYDKYKFKINRHGQFLTKHKGYSSQSMKKDFPEYEMLKFGIDSDSYSGKVLVFPRELEGIENNNGWIPFEEKINIEHNSLPLELYNINTKEHYISFDESEFIEIGRFTHYKIATLSKPPIY